MSALRWTVAALPLIIMPFLTAGTYVRAEGGDLPLVGRYVVVGARAASDVAAPLSVRESDSSKTRIGTELQAGDHVSWYREGERCDVRPGPREGSAALVEPNLADLQIAPAATDARLNQNLIIDCMGRPISDIWEVLVVDQRVLVARSSPFVTYLILEQPLAPGDVRLLKQRLQQAGFDPGSQDEQMDDSTRAAIAAFARKNGAPFLTPGIVTVNLLNALAERSSR